MTGRRSGWLGAPAEAAPLACPRRARAWTAPAGSPADPPAAYGRYLLGHHTPTAALLATPGVKHTWRRLFLRPEAQFPTWEEAYSTTEIVHSEDVQLTADEIVSGAARGGRWVFYSVWEMDEPAGGWEAGGKGVGKDLVLVHGEWQRARGAGAGAAGRPGRTAASRRRGPGRRGER